MNSVKYVCPYTGEDLLFDGEKFSTKVAFHLGHYERLMSNEQEYIIEKVGIFTPKPTDIEELNSGEIGFIITGIKSLSETKVGDTICDASNPIETPLPGFKPSKPVV